MDFPPSCSYMVTQLFALVFLKQTSMLDRNENVRMCTVAL
jgi:hypothetical protein